MNYETAQPGRTIPLPIEDDDPSLWRHVCTAASLGAGVGFLVGWGIDSDQSAPAAAENVPNVESDHDSRITGSVIGLAVGSAAGGIVYGLRR